MTSSLSRNGWHLLAAVLLRASIVRAPGRGTKRLRVLRRPLESTQYLSIRYTERLEGAGDRTVAELRARAERESGTRTRTSTASDEANWTRNYQERRVTRMVEGGFSEDEARRIIEQESEAAFKALESVWEAQRSGAA